MSDSDPHRNLSELYVSMNRSWAQGEEKEDESQAQDEAKEEVYRDLSDEPMPAGEPTALPSSSEVAGSVNELVMTRASLRSFSQYSGLRLTAAYAWGLVGVASFVAGLIALAAVTKAPESQKDSLAGFGLIFLIVVPIKCWFICGLTEAFLDICDALLRGVSRREYSNKQIDA